jgi:spoIIIJ-associated protein
VRSAERALADAEAVELEPMTAIERKVVHVRLKEFDGVETTSEGTEPNRFVVITPVA